MTFDEIIQVVMNRCGARDGSTALETAALLELKVIQTRLEEAPELPWFLLGESIVTSLTPGEPRLAVPIDFLLEEANTEILRQDTTGNWKGLWKVDYDDLLEEYKNEDNGLPTHYALRGKYFYLGPTPDLNYSIEMSCFRADAVPALDTENEWTKYAPDLLIAELGAVIAGEYLSDFQKQQSFEKGIARAASRLYNKEIARDEANQRGQM